jgi:hypothetical protein
VSWPAAVAAVPATLLVWSVLTAVLVAVVADLALGGLVALGVVAGIGCLLLLLPRARARGAGVGAIATLVPCAIGLALSLV